jgi:outer membrane murein-binding lipoprotein Lpp
MDKELQDNLERSGLGGLVEKLLEQNLTNATNERRIRSLENITASVKGSRLSSPRNISSLSADTIETNESVLEKIYNFLVKSSEQDKKRYELDKNFEQERKEESDRKYERLLKVVAENKKLEGKKDEKDKKKSFFETLFGALTKGFGLVFGLMGKTLIGTISVGLKGIRTVLGGLGALISGAFNVVLGTIQKVIDKMGFIGSAIKGVFSVLGKMFSIFTVLRGISAVVGLMNNMLKLGGTVGKIGAGLVTTVGKIVFDILSNSAKALMIFGSKIMEKLVIPMLNGVMKNMVYPALRVLAGELGIALPALGIFAAGAGALYAYKESAPLQYGEKYMKLQSELEEMKKRPGGRNDKTVEDRIKAKEKERDNALEEHYKTVVVPAMKAEGYEEEIHPDGEYGFRKGKDFLKMGKIDPKFLNLPENRPDGTDRNKGMLDKLGSSGLEFVYKHLAGGLQDVADNAEIRAILGKNKVLNYADTTKNQLYDSIEGGKATVEQDLEQTKQRLGETVEQGKQYIEGLPQEALNKFKQFDSDVLHLDSNITALEEEVNKLKQMIMTGADTASETATRISNTASETFGSTMSAASDVANIATESFADVNSVPSALDAVGATLGGTYERLVGDATSSPTASKAFSFAGTLANLANMNVMSGTQSLFSIMAEKANQGLSLDDDKVFSDVVQEFWGKLTASPMGSVPATDTGIIKNIEGSYKSDIPTIGMPTPQIPAAINIPPEPSEDINNVSNAIGAINTPINNVYNNSTQSSGETYLGSPPVRNQHWSLRMVDITSAVPL